MGGLTWAWLGLRRLFPLMSGFRPTVCQIGHKWDKSGTFSDHISFYFISAVLALSYAGGRGVSFILIYGSMNMIQNFRGIACCVSRQLNAEALSYSHT